MKTKLSIAAAALAAVLALSSSANARVYDFTFTATDGGLTATGLFDTSGSLITGISGTVTGSDLSGATQHISGIVANLSFPSYSYSPDGLFIYDNQFLGLGSNPVFTVYGPLFTTFENTSGYWNLWGNSPGSYSLYESASGGYPVAETGSLSISAVPEASTWALMLIGFAGLAFAGLRRDRKIAVSA
jgi:hypothetical protein